MNTKFRAPWSRELRFMTAAACFVCMGIPMIGLVSFARIPPLVQVSILAVPLLILAAGALFMVRGYTLHDQELIVHRLGWCSRIDLRSLVSATHDPSATAGSVRLAGNGGLFAFCGWFSNQALGQYRAFATDPSRSVVLRFSDSTVVVTPDAPGRFVEVIKNE